MTAERRIWYIGGFTTPCWRRKRSFQHFDFLLQNSKRRSSTVPFNLAFCAELESAAFHAGYSNQRQRYQLKTRAGEDSHRNESRFPGSNIRDDVKRDSINESSSHFLNLCNSRVLPYCRWCSRKSPRRFRAVNYAVIMVIVNSHDVFLCIFVFLGQKAHGSSTNRGGRFK
ncbi:hypothetical protein [Escherichia coli]|uniref:hypothetical protein n=1 Tax=Escherichia coli TaxID=562 RepID=UPI00157B1C2B|nr:hypothetical protein [Escherichia coli]